MCQEKGKTLARDSGNVPKAQPLVYLWMNEAGVCI